MDVDSLKAELEEHLAKNPHDQAPGGFRDRFDTLVELYNTEGDEVPKAVWEAELQKVRDEAKAAWMCCASPQGEEAPRAVEADRPAPPGEPISTPAEMPAEAPADAQVDPPSSGFVQRYGIPLVIIVVVLAAAYYLYQR